MYWLPIVPSYQGEASYEIFKRATFGKDITTGLFDVNDDYITIGPSSVFHIKNEIPEWPESKCYVLAPNTCTAEQYAQVLNNTVKVENFFVVEYDVHLDSESLSGNSMEEVVADVAQRVFGYWRWNTPEKYCLNLRLDARASFRIYNLIYKHWNGWFLCPRYYCDLLFTIQ